MVCDHIDPNLSNFQEINSKQRTVLCLNENILNFGENVCLGVLLYSKNGLVSKIIF